jgi:hypothetical protein
VRLTEIEALQAEGLAAEAKAAIDAAASWLAQCASNIEDAGLKASFLGHIPEHAKLVELARIGRE